MSWTQEKVEKLKELWGRGNTASQIAEIIGGICQLAKKIYGLINLFIVFMRSLN